MSFVWTDLRRAIAASIFDPGVTEGYKGDRELTEWQTESVVRAIDEQFSPALRDVILERRRQIDVEGWTAEHDDAHADRSMGVAAACYALFGSVSDSNRASTEMPASLTINKKSIKGWSAWLTLWPWDRRWWKPTDRRRDLVKAAALLVAEIERLDRSTIKSGGAA